MAFVGSAASVTTAAAVLSDLDAIVGSSASVSTAVGGFIIPFAGSSRGISSAATSLSEPDSFIPTAASRSTSNAYLNSPLSGVIGALSTATGGFIIPFAGLTSRSVSTATATFRLPTPPVPPTPAAVMRGPSTRKLRSLSVVGTVDGSAQSAIGSVTAAPLIKAVPLEAVMPGKPIVVN